MRMYIVEWKCGTKSGNLYIKAEDEEQALNKAITDYWRTVDDIVSVKQVHQESDYYKDVYYQDQPLSHQLLSDQPLGCNTYICHVYPFRR